jgi:hypothetical protein
VESSLVCAVTKMTGVAPQEREAVEAGHHHVRDDEVRSDRTGEQTSVGRMNA